MTLYLLYESASGYALLQRIESEEIGNEMDDVRASLKDFARFSKLVKLHAFLPFTSAENALDNINCISEGILSDTLKVFLEQNLPKVKKLKKAKFSVGVVDHKIGQTIQETLTLPCQSSPVIEELLRGIRIHLPKFIAHLSENDLMKAQLGLSHSYSRAKVKFNVNRVDNMVIQSIALLDQLDKDLNTFSMRVREWYSWHFPELSKVVKDNYIFARCAKFIGNKTNLNDKSVAGLNEIVKDEELANRILSESRSSMGTDISDIDLINIQHFTDRVISLAEFRLKLQEYLHSKMDSCAPNLSTLIGDAVGARLISHAGSLTNLAKYPASTIQILGAEKALFRALKTKGNTPKYGLIFHSSFIQKAAPKNKGRISRYLANKCAMAARIDCFSDTPNKIFGTVLRDQVEERLNFYSTGEAPKPNIDVMHEANVEFLKTNPIIKKVEADGDVVMKEEVSLDKKKKKKSKKEKKDKKKKKKDKNASEEPVEEAKDSEEEPTKEKKSKKKKSKKRKASAVEDAAEDTPKKKKKKKKSKNKSD